MGSKVFSGEVWTNIHPRILRAIREANESPADGKVGRDSATKRAEALILEQLPCPASIFETLNGTAANVLALKVMLHPWGSVLCAECTHVNVHESGAAEYTLGTKVLTIPSPDGKLDPAWVRRRIASAARVGDHPEVLVLTQPTEYGVLYTREELASLAEAAHQNGMLVYVDGARLFFALAATGLTLREMLVEPGIDAFSLGGTKCGLLFGEMVVLLRPEHGLHLEYLQKQSMQHLDKSKFLGAQFEALLRDGLWREIAESANAHARRLGDGLSERGIRPEFPVETNQVFCPLSESQYTRVTSTYDVHSWIEGRLVPRFCTTHETTRADIDGLLSLL